jgi:hypothetical protein
LDDTALDSLSDSDADTETDTDTDTDTDSDTDTDTDTDSDTDTDTDTETVPLSLSYIGGDAGGKMIAVIEVDLWSNEELTVLGELTSSALTGENDILDLPVLAEEDLIEIDPVSAPGLLLAAFWAGVYDDDDGDQQHDDGDEQFVGFPTALWLVAVDGTVLDYFGVVPGWYILTLDVLGELHFNELSIGLEMRLYSEESSITVGGGSANLPPNPNLAAAIVPSTLFDGADATLVHDGADPSAWSYTLIGAPPDDHLIRDRDQAGHEIEYAYEVPLAYIDQNGSGGLDGGDTPVSFACDGTSTATLYYIPPQPWASAAIQASVFGLDLG